VTTVKIKLMNTVCHLSSFKCVCNRNEWAFLLLKYCCSCAIGMGRGRPATYVGVRFWVTGQTKLGKHELRDTVTVRYTNLLCTCVLYLLAYSIARNTYTITKHENRAKKCEKTADACTSQFYFTNFSWRRWWWLWSQRWWLLIQFKIAVLRYRVLHGDASRYMGPFTSTADDVPGRWALRSAGTNRQVVPSS